MGIVYTNIEDMAPHLGPSIITIGDVVTSIFEAAGIPPDISIIDQLTEREPINFPRPFSHLATIFKINNPHIAQNGVGIAIIGITCSSVFPVSYKHLTLPTIYSV